MVLEGKGHIVHMDGRARAAACGERYVDRFEGVCLHSPFLKPVFDCEEMGLEFLGGYGGIVYKCGYGCCCGGWKVLRV
jgi:hypothetical protein